MFFILNQVFTVEIKLANPVKTIWTPIVATIRPVMRMSAFIKSYFVSRFSIGWEYSIIKRFAPKRHKYSIW